MEENERAWERGQQQQHHRERASNPSALGNEAHFRREAIRHRQSFRNYTRTSSSSSNTLDGWSRQAGVEAFARSWGRQQPMTSAGTALGCDDQIRRETILKSLHTEPFAYSFGPVSVCMGGDEKTSGDTVVHEPVETSVDHILVEEGSLSPAVPTEIYTTEHSNIKYNSFRGWLSRITPRSIRSAATAPPQHDSIQAVCSSVPAENNLANDIECPICLDVYEKGETIAWSNETVCHHRFHKDCIVTWLMQNDDCPMCRTILIRWAENAFTTRTQQQPQ